MNYKKALKLNKDKAKEYYFKSVEKTEQQKFLECLLKEAIPSDGFEKKWAIADVACGGGTLTYHLSSMFSNAQFTLIDFNEDAIEIAKQINSTQQCSFLNDTIYDLSKLADDSFDFVFCWQTLSWLDEPEKALNELIRITKPGGCLYLSS